MSCKPTNVPSVDEINIPELTEKYRYERDKRIRSEGQSQYERPTGDFADTYEGDPHMPVQARDPVSDDIDVVILGGGWAGTLAGVNLRKAGVKDICHIDHAGDFGGVWYWNRYPGIQCDNDAYCYLPLLEEMGYMPTQKFTDGKEIYAYFRMIAKKFDLYDRPLFHTTVEALRWDDSLQRWRISTDRGDDIRARFVVMANGLLNIPKLPGIPGIHHFKGKMFHTARWDYDYTGGEYGSPLLDKLHDKTVAIVGTGATAIQAVPYLGKYARKLYVLQRTPSSVDVRPNPSTDPEWVKTLQPGWQKHRQDNFHRAVIEGQILPGEGDLICDFWTEITRNVMAELEAEGWPQLSMEEFIQRRDEMDFQVMERMRRRIAAIVEDQDTAEALKPWYRFPCKRPLSNDEYFPTFNRPNVQLIDVSATRGVEAMTEKGFMADGREYPIDCMIFASGFEVTSDLDRRWGIDVIEGRDGVSIYDHWAYGYKTLHGSMTCGFPNQFFVGMYQSALNASVPEMFNSQGAHIAYIIKEALARGASVVEPTEEAQAAYVRHIRDNAIDISALQRECTPSYLNNEGESQKDQDGNEKYRWYLGETGYLPGKQAFEAMLQQWRDSGDMAGLALGQ